jgi:putative SOS response-associated peptidase YedK
MMLAMCGRYSITVDKSTIEYHFNVKFSSGKIAFQPTYNAAPSQLLPIITTYAPTEIVLGKWGFVPQCNRALAQENGDNFRFGVGRRLAARPQF